MGNTFPALFRSPLHDHPVSSFVMPFLRPGLFVVTTSGADAVQDGRRPPRSRGASSTAANPVMAAGKLHKVALVACCGSC
jgi:hypothetical protein